MGIRMLHGILQGYNKAQKDYNSVKTARAKNERDDEMYKLNKKKLELDLEEKVRSGEVQNILADQYRKQFQNDASRNKVNSDIKNKMFDEDENNLATKLGFLERTANKEVASIQQNLGSIENEGSVVKYSKTKGYYKEKKKDVFREDLQKADLGQVSYEQVRKKYPDEATEIKKARFNRLDTRSQGVLNQIATMEKAMAESVAKGLTEETVESRTMDKLVELMSREEEAKKKGMNIDEILAIKGISREEVLEYDSIKDEPDKKDTFLKRLSNLFSGN